MKKLTAISVAAALIGGAALAPSVVGAQTGGCDGIEIVFDARLLNNGTDDESNIEAVDVPAGEYEITLFSSDEGHTDPDLPPFPEQTEERWALLLDGSPVAVSADVPLEVTSSSRTQVNTVAAASTAQAVHMRQGGVNSVVAVSACLVPIVPEPAPTTTTTSEAPATTQPPAPAPVEVTEPEPAPAPVAEPVPAAPPMLKLAG